MVACAPGCSADKNVGAVCTPWAGVLYTKIPGLGNCVRVLTAAGICKIQEKALTRTLAPKGRTRSALKLMLTM